MKICKYCNCEYNEEESRCPSCGATDHKHRCENCGSVVEDGRFCGKCGVKIGSRAKICPNCGTEYFSKACPDCGYIEEVPTRSASYSYDYQPQQRVVYINNGDVVTENMMKRRCDKWVALLLCFFLGWLGIHKFYEKRIFLGILYLFTFGLFGIGVFIDFIVLLFKPNPYYV